MTMENDKLLTMLYRIQFGIFSAMLLIVPLVFDIAAYQVFAVPKAAIFDLLFMGWLFVWVWRIYLSRGVQWPESRYLDWLFLAFVAVLAASLVNAAVFEQAWFGSALRLFGGQVRWQLLMLFAWLVIDFPAIKNSLGRLYWVAMVAGTTAASYGLVQVAGLDPLHWAKLDEVRQRASGTLGQPNFLGSFLLATLPLTWLAMQRSRRRQWRSLAAAALALQGACLVFTLSRGAWLGLCGAGVAFAFAYLYKKRRRWLIGAILSVLLLGAVIHGMANNPGSRAAAADNWSLAARLASLADFKQDSLRYYYYRSAWQLVKTRLFGGFGYDQLGYYFYPFYDSNWAVFEVVNQATDRAHNFWLDEWLQAGLAGVVWWAAFLGYLIYIAYRGLKKEQAAWLFGALAVLISWQVSFMTLEPAIWWWLLAGLLFGSAVEKRKTVGLQHAAVVLAGFVVMAASFYGAVIGVERWQAGRIYRQALAAAQRDAGGELPLMVELAGKVPDSDLASFYGGDFFRLLNNSVAGQKIDRQQFTRVLGLLEDLNSEPLTFEWQVNRLALLTSMSKRELSRPAGQAIAAGLEQEFARLKQQAPGSALVEFLWGNLHFYQRDCQTAGRHYQAALALYPHLDDPRMNSEHRGYVQAERSQVLSQLAVCQSQLGRGIIK